MDTGTKYGDPRLNWKLRNTAGVERPLFQATDDDGTLQLRCMLCEMTIFGLNNLDVHISGKKHATNLRTLGWNLVEVNVQNQFSVAATTASVSKPTKGAISIKINSSCLEPTQESGNQSVDNTKVFRNTLLNCGATQNKISGIPAEKSVIGVEYIVEVVEEGYRASPAIHCLLCEKELNLVVVAEHLLAPSHRLRYLECFFPSVRRKFAKVPNVRFWKTQAFDFLDSVVTRIEAKHGRQKAWTVIGKDFFAKEIEKIKAVVENSQHVSEDETLNFRTIPDPFGSFIWEVPKEEVVLIGALPLPQKRAGIKVSDRYLNLTLEQLPQQQAQEKQEVDEDPQATQAALLNKIATLRKAVNEDDTFVNNMLKFKKDNSQKLEKLFTAMQRSKTKEGDGSDKDDDEEEKETDMNDLKLRKPAGPRGLRSKNFDPRDYSKTAAQSEEKPSGSSRSRRDSRSRERTTIKTSSDGRSNREDRGSARRASPAPNRSRTIRRSRSRERRKSRSRSISPYVLAMEKWQKFKKAEAAMLNNVQQKKEFFERRPEDHPKYGEEWRLFWERRYKELQQQGRDPDAHDYQSEWIPYWLQKLSQLFDIDVLEKTDDLMRKFELSSVEEPKREDYARPEPPPKKAPPSAGEKRKEAADRSRSGSRRARRRKTSRSPSAEEYSSRRRDQQRALSKERRRRQRSASSSLSPRPARKRSGSRGRTTRNPSPPGHRSTTDIPGLGRTGPSRLASGKSDLYSGITELEKRRDRGRSSDSLSPPQSHRRHRSPSPLHLVGEVFHQRDLSGPVELISVVRLLTALEDSLGSLGPQVNQILAHALSLEQNRDGASRILLEDPDTVSILELVKEKLAGQMVAGILTGSRAAAVRVALDHLTRLMQTATKKRSLNVLGSRGGGSGIVGADGNINQLAVATHIELRTEAAVNTFIARSIATVLVTTDRAEISDEELEQLVEETMRLMAQDYAATGERSTTDSATTAVGRVARSYTEGLELERQLAQQQERAAQLAAASLPLLLSSAGVGPKAASDNSGSSRAAPPRRRSFIEEDPDVRDMKELAGPAYITPVFTEPTVNKQDTGNDELDDLTPDELKSLLDNFQTLSKQEQEDLIVYMRRLETSQPERVRDLWPLVTGGRGPSPSLLPTSAANRFVRSAAANRSGGWEEEEDEVMLSSRSRRVMSWSPSRLGLEAQLPTAPLRSGGRIMEDGDEDVICVEVETERPEQRTAPRVHQDDNHGDLVEIIDDDHHEPKRQYPPGSSINTSRWRPVQGQQESPRNGAREPGPCNNTDDHRWAESLEEEARRYGGDDEGWNDEKRRPGAEWQNGEWGTSDGYGDENGEEDDLWNAVASRSEDGGHHGGYY